jgi:hypothetical protein
MMSLGSWRTKIIEHIESRTSSRGNNRRREQWFQNVLPSICSLVKTLVLPFGQKIAVWDASPLRTNRRAEDCQQENNIRGLLQVGCGALPIIFSEIYGS